MSETPRNGADSPELVRALMLPTEQLAEWGAREANRAKRVAQATSDTISEAIGVLTREVADCKNAASACAREARALREEMVGHRTAIAAAVAAATGASTVAASAANEARAKADSVHDLEKKVDQLEDDFEEATNPGRPPIDSDRVQAIQRAHDQEVEIQRLTADLRAKEEAERKAEARAEDDARERSKTKRDIRVGIIVGVVVLLAGSIGSCLVGVAQTEAKHQIHDAAGPHP